MPSYIVTIKVSGMPNLDAATLREVMSSESDGKILHAVLVSLHGA